MKFQYFKNYLARLKLKLNFINLWLSSKELNKTQRKVFRMFIKTEEFRYKRKLIFDEKKLSDLFLFCLFKRIPIFLIVVVGAKKVSIKKKVRKDLQSVIDSESFAELYFNWSASKWIKGKWYKNDKLPIVANINGVDRVIDGNHRLAQQIHHQEIRYYHIDGDISWKNLYKVLK